MDTPVPAPRLLIETKKPIPTPRRSVLIRQRSNESSSSSSSPPPPSTPLPTPPSLATSPKSFEEATHTFSRRVRSLSTASGQIAKDLSKRMQDGKEAVIEGTRESIRRFTKRIKSTSQLPVEPQTDEVDNKTIDILNSISFESPISTTKEQLYKNVDPDACSSTESFSLPPPSHPPPSLPDDSYYDAPQSLCASSINGSESKTTSNTGSYESIFPPFSSTSWKYFSTNNGNENANENTDNNKHPELRNAMYENHMLQSTRCTESVIIEFDPLRNVEPNRIDMKALEELLQEGLYGSLSNTVEDWSISNDSDRDEPTSPPPPPVRVDSLPEEVPPIIPPTNQQREKTSTSWYLSGEPDKDDNSNKKISWLKQVLEKAPDVVRGNVRNTKDLVVQRPPVNVRNFVYKKGMLFRVQNGPVEDLFGEYSGRWCVLNKSNFICYADNTCGTIRENFPAENVLSIQILQDPKYKYKYDNDDLHCFELNTTGKARGGHIYGTRDISERRIWMQMIAESLTNNFVTKITSDYSRMGWAYLREGVSGDWQGAWLILSHRVLYYAIEGQSLKMLDLRKARCIVLHLYRESDNNPRTNDNGPNMVVDSPDITLYIRMWTSRETKVWCHIVKLAAHNNGARLDQQQLTKHDVPVVVEKCINFIYVYGSMSEGIYRRPGVDSAISEILSKFRKDAWAVQLTDKYTENDVATALKRFFRDLPESLLGSSNRQYFHQVSIIENRAEKIRMYKAALDNLSPVAFKCVRKLLGHLHFISTQSAKNLMTIENLGAIWGPTLMHADDKDATMSRSHQQDAIVVAQLIELYRHIFPEEPGELEQEQIMLKVLQRYTNAAQGAVGNNKVTGEFRVWIYLHSKEGKTFNLAIGPNKTAYEVCVELSKEINLPVQQLIIEEIVLNDKLSRPIHHSEKVLDVVLRWGYWDEADRKDNHLIVTRLTKYLDFIQESQQLPVLSGELRFADTKSKNFKSYIFEFSQAKLSCFKDKSCEVRLFSWNIEDIVWYLGNEYKRNPQSRWTITILETKNPPNRTKNSPYFGNILVFVDPATRAKWLSTMLKSRYNQCLTPPPALFDVLSHNSLL